jgi:xanthine dehydrogenase accessory factor
MPNVHNLDVFLIEQGEIAKVLLTRVRGSSPREQGTWMLVSLTATCGTIGGGQLEYMVIDEARAMLKRKMIKATMDIPLGPEIGQCCGGRVEVQLSLMNDDDKQNLRQVSLHETKAFPHVYILGAGHVGRALAETFERLPVRTIVIDSRAEELEQCNALVELRQSAIPEADIRTAPKGSAFIILTHDHALDFLLSEEALRRGDATYVGMIGSKTKRASFENWYNRDHDDQSISALTCPIGAIGSRDKRPAVIAAFVAAEVITALTSETTVNIPEKGTVSQ